MTDYQRGLADADEVIKSWMDPQRPAEQIELLQAIRADLALKIESSKKA